MVAEVPQPARALDPFLLRRIVRAAQEGVMLRLRYQSMDQAEPTSSWFVPRAFVTNGQRWHLRAYNVDRDRFEDLLFPRIMEIEEKEPAAVVPVDTSWERRVNVRLRPSGRLSPTQQLVISSDYGMTEGETVVEVRIAELFLFLRRLGVDREGALVEVVNRDEIDVELSRERAAFGMQTAEL